MSGMFSRLFQRRPAEPEKVPARVPAGSRIYAIGDVHGRADLLRKLHGMIAADAQAHAAERRTVIYLGDYIDRGTESRAVIDMLIDAQLPGFETVFLRGNHEDSLLRFLEDPVKTAGAWLAYGGDATLMSYGVSPPNPGQDDSIRAAREAFANKLPAAHLEFFQATRLIHVEGDYAFVHAGVREGVPILNQAATDMLWIRDEFLRSQADFGKIVVHGHTISEAPVMRRNRIGIDTGAFATGILTCLTLFDAETQFLAT